MLRKFIVQNEKMINECWGYWRGKNESVGYLRNFTLEEEFYDF